MFDALSDKLKKVLKDLRGESRLSQEHLEAAMREIRIALLEADVNFKVVKDFIERVKAKAVGQEVLQKLSPGQQIIKIVNDEMIEMLGGTSSRLLFTSKRPNSVMIVGLQGSGKTTSTGKLSKWLAANQQRNPLLLSVDVYRPAARNQLSVIGKAIGIPVFEGEGINDPLALCRAARTYCEQVGFDTLLIDTASRLQIDDALMQELESIKAEMQPIETLFVADSMTGQDAVNSAKGFHDRIGITGVILTKMDGDTRGGAALSIKEVIGQPIKFVGVGEKYDALEPFYPDRIVSRILGMGDVLSLIEKVQAEVDEEKAEELERKLMQNEFTLEDFRDQLGQMKKLGSIGSLLDMLPGDMFGGMMPKMTPEMSAQMEGEMKRTEAIINSMTPAERNDYRLIDNSRKIRIANGSGTKVQDVVNMLKQYVEMRKMVRMMMGSDPDAPQGMLGGLKNKMMRGLTGVGKRAKQTQQKKVNPKRNGGDSVFSFQFSVFSWNSSCDNRQPTTDNRQPPDEEDMLAIRLTRMGTKKKPFYRVVVAEKRSKRDGKFVEIVGHYNPCSNPAQIMINQERVQHWIGCGAQPSDTVRSLIRKNAAAQPAVVEVAVEAEAAA